MVRASMRACVRAGVGVYEDDVRTYACVCLRARAPPQMCVCVYVCVRTRARACTSAHDAISRYDDLALRTTHGTHPPPHAPTHPRTHEPTHPRTHAPTHTNTHIHTHTVTYNREERARAREKERGKIVTPACQNQAHVNFSLLPHSPTRQLLSPSQTHSQVNFSLPPSLTQSPPLPPHLPPSLTLSRSLFPPFSLPRHQCAGPKVWE